MNMECPRCGSSRITKNGKRHDKVQGYKCSDCGKQFYERIGTFMYRKRFPEKIIKIARL
jgi:transposase-like protein